MYSNVEPGGYEFENTTGDGGKNGSFIDEGLWEGGRVPIGSSATDELWQQTPSSTGQRNWQMATLNLGKRRCVWQDVRARCQVEGCSEELGSGKEYYRRHKVCDAHSKSPRVSMLGIHQRFCQQCSRFHSLAEFDAAKRSCRRRLAGHNERRRKSSSQHQERIFPSHAPSLLSSNASSWPPSSISDMSSAALQELIEENRVAVSGRHGLQPALTRENGYIF